LPHDVKTQIVGDQTILSKPRCMPSIFTWLRQYPGGHRRLRLSLEFPRHLHRFNSYSYINHRHLRLMAAMGFTLNQITMLALTLMWEL